MRAADFDFELPPSAIAQQASERGRSRLLVLDAEGEARHRTVADLPEILRPGDLVVVNDTRVIPARLFGRAAGGGKVEILLLEEMDAQTWLALCKPGRKTRPGDRIALDGLDATVEATLEDGRRRLHFSEPIGPHLERLGHVPLPPYIARPDEAADRERYQTVWAREAGAIAAPTAGLHFTPEILDALERRGIERAAITLHVGIGTFKPVQVDEVDEHVMDAERWMVPEATADAIAAARARGGRVVAIGTTVARTLESAVDAEGVVRAGSGRTALFIRPGFQFRAVDVLLTNFHLPRSTLLMLVSAFAGQGGRLRMLDAYAEAIAAGYRFYSYGDAMLLERG
jgi:S-adenosylmethionine:tRNA ribosyltransferase-isomerase